MSDPWAESDPEYGTEAAYDRDENPDADDDNRETRGWYPDWTGPDVTDEAECGYDLDDPKHPAYHERMSDLGVWL